MFRNGLFASAFAAGALLIAPQAQASANFGTISGIINQLHNNSHFSGNNMSFSAGPGGPQFTGVTGLHQYLNSGNGLDDFNAWANPGGGTPPTNSYHFTYTVLGSYFGHQTPQSTPQSDNTVHTAFYAVETPPVPEPGTWAMMIFGFGVVGMAMRRRHRIATNFA